jgi:hypothetical protein
VADSRPVEEVRRPEAGSRQLAGIRPVEEVRCRVPGSRRVAGNRPVKEVRRQVAGSRQVEEVRRLEVVRRLKDADLEEFLRLRGSRSLFWPPRNGRHLNALGTSAGGGR